MNPSAMLPVFPVLTALGAGILALWLAALSAWVMARRMARGILHGDGNDEVLARRIRAHGNFAEYVPTVLVVLALLEMAGGARGLVETLVAALVLGRMLHPFGMGAAPNSPRQFACRGLGIVLTLGALTVGAGALLLRVA